MINIDKYITGEYKLDENYYYHAFEKNSMIPILKDGIKCTFLQSKKNNGGYNGAFYVSICKKTDFIKSAYKLYSDDKYDMFILSPSIRAIKTHKNGIVDLFADTIVPVRSSVYDDEFQVFLKIAPSYIKGIRLSELQDKDDLVNLKNKLLILKKYNIDIPVYDFSLEESGIIRKINKTKILCEI